MIQLSPDTRRNVVDVLRSRIAELLERNRTESRLTNPIPDDAHIEPDARIAAGATSGDVGEAGARDDGG